MRQLAADLNFVTCKCVAFGRETSAIRVNDVFTHVSASVGAAVEATNNQLESSNTCAFDYDRRCPKRQCRVPDRDVTTAVKDQKGSAEIRPLGATPRSTIARQKDQIITSYVPTAAEEQESLAAMVAVLCEQQRFVPLLRAFELFTPTSPLLPFIRFLQVSSIIHLQCCISANQTIMSNFIAFNLSTLISRLYCMIIGNTESYVGGESGSQPSF